MSDLTNDAMPSTDQSMGGDETPLTSAWRPSGVRIGQWEIRRYQQTLGWPALLMAFSTLAAVLWWDFDDTWLFGMEGVATVLLGLLVTVRGGEKTETLTAGFALGVLMGGGAALGRLVLEPHWVWGVNLLSEPPLTGLAASLICTSTYLIRKTFNR